MRPSIPALVIVLFPLFASSGHGRTWHVRPDGSGDVATIQQAIDIAQPGDDVLLAPGTYTWSNQNASGNSMLVMKSGIWLHSEVGPELTVIDAERNGRVILCEGASDQTTIQGLKITGGEVYGPGAGINCVNASPEIRENVIHGNHAWDFYYHGGGGIACSGDSFPMIEDNVVSSNGSCFAGGISCHGSANPFILENVIKDNVASICWATSGQAPPQEGQNRGEAMPLTWSQSGGIGCLGSSP